MIKKTSRDAYVASEASGALSMRRMQALKVLVEYGPMTGQELCQKAGVAGLYKRLSELEKSGHVKVIGEKNCSVTGIKAMLWDVVTS